MNTIHKILALLLIIIFVYSCTSETQKKNEDYRSIAEIIGETTALRWLNEHKDPEGNYSSDFLDKLESHYYYELGPQKLPLAVRALNSTAIIELSNQDALYYNQHYKKEPNTKAYLVRAVFSNYTGGLHIYQDDDGTLIIMHLSLGRGNTPDFTPLIVNLSKKPNKLILSIGSAL